MSPVLSTLDSWQFDFCRLQYRTFASAVGIYWQYRWIAPTAPAVESHRDFRSLFEFI